jgi:hypothetical protein
VEELKSFAAYMEAQPLGNPVKQYKAWRGIKQAAAADRRCEALIPAGPAPGTLLRSGPQQPPLDERLIALFDWVADQCECATPWQVHKLLCDEGVQIEACHRGHVWAIDTLMHAWGADLIRRWFHEMTPGETHVGDEYPNESEYRRAQW